MPQKPWPPSDTRAGYCLSHRLNYESCYEKDLCYFSNFLWSQSMNQVCCWCLRLSYANSSVGYWYIVIKHRKKIMSWNKNKEITENQNIYVVLVTDQ